MDKLDNAGPLNVNYFLSKQENSVTQRAFTLNSATATAETWHLEGSGYNTHHSVLFIKHAW
jgi:hypothetical protein